MKILIVGAGFGGLKTAIELARRGLKNITLISNEDYFLHHATMYSTATGRNVKESVFLLKEILDNYPGVKFVKDYISTIDVKNQSVQGVKKSYKYDSLVLSLGLVNQLSGSNANKKYSYGVTSLNDTKIFSETFHDMVIADKKQPTHCVVVGGGMVGVELGGALTDYAKRIKLAHHLSHGEVKISLVEAANQILPFVSDSASRKISKQLKNVGVDINTKCKVGKINKNNVIINGKSALVDMVVWTLGGQNNPFFARHPEVFKLSKRGKVIVNQYMLAYPNVYVIGDNAETIYSGSAVTAIRDAIFIAKNIYRQSVGKSKYARKRLKSPVLSVPVTSFWAYVEYGGVYVAGFSGAVVRRLVELNYYCHFLTLPKAYHLWRKYRKSNNYCQLCKTSELKPAK